MSKALSAGMLTLMASGGRTLEWCVIFSRTDGEVFRYTGAARNATLADEAGSPSVPVLYESQPGFTVSNITCTLGMSVDTLEMTVLTTTDLGRADFLAGRWDGCRVEFRQYDWTTPANGFVPWPVYRVSNVEPIHGGFVLEMRDLRQLLQQDYSRTTGKTCPYRLGDSRCTVVLNGSPSVFTVPFTVTGVTSRSVFTCSGLAQAADFFSNGIVTFDDGLHAGLPLLVREHDAGGVIHLAVPLISDIVVAQTGVIVAGCLKRFEDCRDKFDNVLNFGGQKDAPTVAELAEGATA